MSISNVGSSAATYQYISGIQKSSGKETTFAEKIGEKEVISKENMTLEEYKAYFQRQMDSLYVHPSQANYKNWIIDITDSAYERMKTDPEYEQKVLNAIAVNKAHNFGNYIPKFSYTHIDDTWEKSYGYTQGMEDNYNNPGSGKSSGGLGDWWIERHQRYEDWIQEQIKETQINTSESMEAFKRAFYDELQKIGINNSIVNFAVHITEKAFENMKADPEYREKILSLLQRDLGSYYGSGPRRASVMLTVGATLDEYRGDSWPICNDSEFHVRSRNSFYQGNNKRRDRLEEINEHYQEKRVQAKNLHDNILKKNMVKQELEHRSLMKSWYRANQSYNLNIQ